MSDPSSPKSSHHLGPTQQVPAGFRVAFGRAKAELAREEERFLTTLEMAVEGAPIRSDSRDRPMTPRDLDRMFAYLTSRFAAVVEADSARRPIAKSQNELVKFTAPLVMNAAAQYEVARFRFGLPRGRHFGDMLFVGQAVEHAPEEPLADTLRMAWNDTCTAYQLLEAPLFSVPTAAVEAVRDLPFSVANVTSARLPFANNVVWFEQSVALNVTRGQIKDPLIAPLVAAGVVETNRLGFVRNSGHAVGGVLFRSGDTGLPQAEVLVGQVQPDGDFVPTLSVAFDLTQRSVFSSLIGNSLSLLSFEAWRRSDGGTKRSPSAVYSIDVSDPDGARQQRKTHTNQLGSARPLTVGESTNWLGSNAVRNVEGLATARELSVNTAQRLDDGGLPMV